MMGPSKDSHRLLRTIRRRKAPVGKPQQLGSCDGRWQRLNSGVSYRLRFCSEAAGCHPFQPKKLLVRVRHGTLGSGHQSPVSRAAGPCACCR
jgi:hypothetical protein